MKITLLVDKTDNPEFKSEFGLSLLLEDDSGSWLFDTGANEALEHNLKILAIAPEKIRRVILSHGHYDHTGGLAKIKPDAVWSCRSVMQSHYSFHAADDIHNIAMPAAAQAILQQTSWHWVEDFTALTENICLTGPIPRQSSEDCGGRFFHDLQCKTPDIVDDELALLTKSGVLITGCCHAGIINTVEFCRKLHPEIKIRTIAGGLHLRNASIERLQETADFLQDLQLEKMYLMHCTGSNAVDFLRNALDSVEIISPTPGESWVC